MSSTTTPYAHLSQLDLVRLIETYRYILNDPSRPPTDKAEAQRALAALYQPAYSPTTQVEHNNRVLGGYRATLANPNVSEAAKAHARAMLEQAGADVRTLKERTAMRASGSGAGSNGSTSGSDGEGRRDAHLARQLGGYKSALKNPNVSPEAKAHARNMLAQHGITY
ncbi:hypothetical protein PIIN_09097 [Serendipita indica DSM 11827]|uniref:Uncharacterized protein n=1 Tax=Serendipita indica (strain DSM 11827) TaxID=1109443 RepID=G4TUX0_SERID|nr:hypothetical protein PIIN_09097 [Serendipita indica DSM 11827]